jgi:hypothetical protein
LRGGFKTSHDPPRPCTITVYRGDSKPQLFNADPMIGADPHLPGFQVSAEEVFLP